MTVFQEAGRYGGWPANHGLWAWGTEAVLGFTSAWYRPTTSGHAVDRDRKIEDWQARTLDAGDTWSLEKPSVSTNGDNYLPKAEPLNEPTSAYKRIGEYVFGSGTENSHVFVDGKEFAHQKADFAKVGDLGDADPPGDLISRHIWNESNFPDFRDADVVDIVRDYGATPDNEADDDAVAIQRAINDTTTPGSINFGKAVFIPRGHFHIKQPIFVHGGARLFGASNTISVIEISQSWQPASPTAALVTDDKADSGVLLATFAILGSDPTPFKGVSSQKYISELVLQTNNTLLRDLQFTAREYFRTDNVYQEPLVVLGGNAGGRLYNMALDTDTAHSTGAMSPNFHIIAIRGTVNQIQMYQPDTEHMDAGPQMEIASSRNVFLYAYKYELANPLCTVRDSSNVGLFGGSGNYSLYGAGETSIFTVVNSSNYVFANMARKPDPSNPRDKPNAAQFDVISDGVNHIPANEDNLALFKSGELSIAAAGQPKIASGGIVIHAGVSGTVSPGSLADIYGTDMAVSAVSAPAAAKLPATLGGASVIVNGIAAPLIYVSSTQIVFQIPYETAVGTASVTVVDNNVAGIVAPVNVQPAAPFILTYGANRAVVVNGDGSINSAASGAKSGSSLVAYLTGSGPLDNPIATGAPSPSSPLSRQTLNTTVTVGGATAAVQFAGMAPGFLGLVQLNFVVPSLPPGDCPLQVSIGGTVSNQPLLTITQ